MAKKLGSSQSIKSNLNQALHPNKSENRLILKIQKKKILK